MFVRIDIWHKDHRKEMYKLSEVYKLSAKLTMYKLHTLLNIAITILMASQDLNPADTCVSCTLLMEGPADCMDIEDFIELIT